MLPLFTIYFTILPTFRCSNHNVMTLLPIPYQNIRSLVYISCKYAANLQHVCGLYLRRVCRKRVFRMQISFLAHCSGTHNVRRNVRRKYAAHSCRALFWHTMCAVQVCDSAVAAHCTGTQCAPQVCSAQLSRTILAHWQVSLHIVAAHCTGTQCAPQVCSAQLSRTILAHNVRRKFAAHSCRTLFLCATSLRRTVAVHCAVLPPPYPPHPTPGLSPPPPYFFLVPYPQGECEKKCGDGRSVTKNKNLGVGVGKNVGAGGW